MSELGIISISYLIDLMFSSCAAPSPVPVRTFSRRSDSVVARASASSEDASALSRRAIVGLGLAASIATSTVVVPGPAQATQVISSDWEVVSAGEYHATGNHACDVHSSALNLG